MAYEFPTVKECFGYWTSSIKGVWKQHRLSPFIRGPSAALIGALFKYHFSLTAFRATDVPLLILYAFIAYAMLWLLEFLFRLAVVSPVNINKQLQRLEDAAKIKLSIEEAKCQHSVVHSECFCQVAIRNLSQIATAENVSVRIEGAVANESMFIAGYNPFHVADLIPSSGHRSINPGETADFIFPKLVNDMVGALRRSKPHGEKPQTFVIKVSSSTSPQIQQGFVFVKDDYYHVSIVKQ